MPANDPTAKSRETHPLWIKKFYNGSDKERKDMTDNNGMVIARLGLASDVLQGETVIVTGAGGGIGYETARALLWLGANVVIAEINTPNGLKAAEKTRG